MAMLQLWFSIAILSFALFPSLNTGSYQFFQFVQQWPPNVCYGRRSPCFNNPSNIFTIHGLWPSNVSNNNNQPNCQGHGFNARMLLLNHTLETELKSSWPDIIRGDDRAFWTGEWNKHGKCSLQTYSQTQYFQRSLQMYDSYNITKILEDAKIITGAANPTRRSYADIEQPISAVTHKTPLLRCRLQKLAQPRQLNQRVHLLFEVALCYDYSGRNLMNCSSSIHGACPSGADVWF